MDPGGRRLLGGRKRTPAAASGPPAAQGPEEEKGRGREDGLGTHTAGITSFSTGPVRKQVPLSHART